MKKSVVIAKRVLIILALACGVLALCKYVTSSWRQAEKVKYEEAWNRLKYHENVDVIVPMGEPIEVKDDRNWFKKKWDLILLKLSECKTAALRPYNQTKHAIENLPEAMTALLMYSIAVVVDALIVWVVIVVSLVKILCWAGGKMLNAWVDSESPTEIQRVRAKKLPTGDVVIQIGHGVLNDVLKELDN